MLTGANNALGRRLQRLAFVNQSYARLKGFKVDDMEYLASQAQLSKFQEQEGKREKEEEDERQWQFLKRFQYR